MSTCLGCRSVTCTCVLQGSGLATVTGEGSEESPYVVGVSCAGVLACVGPMFTDIGFTDGLLATGADGEHLEADETEGHAVWASGMTAYFLYDTREWDGGAVIPNLGVAGPGPGNVYNLTVSTYSSGTIQRAQSDVATPSFSWADVGGVADSAGFTFVVAVGGFRRTSPGRTIVEADIIFNHDVATNRFWHGIVDFVAATLAGDSPSELMYKKQSGSFVANVESFTLFDLENTVVVLAHDAVAGTYGIWLDGVPISGGDYGTITGMGGGLHYTSPTVADIFFYLGENKPPAVSGKWANGAYAMGLYRGYPTTFDIAAFQAFFG